MVTRNVISLDQTFGKNYACFKFELHSYKHIKVIKIRITRFKIKRILQEKIIFILKEFL